MFIKLNATKLIFIVAISAIFSGTGMAESGGAGELLKAVVTTAVGVAVTSQASLITAAVGDGAVTTKYEKICGPQPWACGIAAALAAQTVMDLALADDAEKTFKAASEQGDVYVPLNQHLGPLMEGVSQDTELAGVYGADLENGGDLYYSKKDHERVKKHFKGVLDGYKAQGYEVNGDGSVTLPDGSKVNMDSLTSGEGIMAAGLGGPGSSAEGIQSTIDSINDSVKKTYGAALKSGIKPLALGGRSGGGYSQRSRRPASAAQQNPFNFKFPGQAKKIKPPQKAGLKRMVAGEPIGVKVDNLFEMVQRRYADHQRQGNFISTK